jgi:hypothetical protein
VLIYYRQSAVNTFINIFIDDHFPLIISEMKVHGNFSDLNNILKDSLMNSIKKWAMISTISENSSVILYSLLIV